MIACTFRELSPVSAALQSALTSFNSLFWFDKPQLFTVLVHSNRSHQPCFQLQQAAVFQWNNF